MNQSIWIICVPPIVCMLSGKSVDLFIAASSSSAGGPPNISHNTTTNQAHHQSLIQQDTIDTCGVKK